MILVIRNSIFKMLSFFALLLVLSCEKDELSIAENLYGKWEVSYMEPNGLFKEKMNPDGFNPKIYFIEDGSLNLFLSANSCGGEFKITNINELNIDETWCTELCCDDDFSKEFAKLLEKVSSFELISKNSLELNIKGWGVISLTRYSISTQD